MKRLALLLFLLLACARGGLVRPDIHQRGWLLVETAHISLRTDLGRDDAMKHAARLEEYWDALAHLYDFVAPGRQPPVRPFSVIHLDSCSDFARLQHDSSGFVFTSLRGEDVAVTCEGRGEDTLIHELAHIFNHHHFARLPRWVDEGLATYYETLEVRDGRAALGNFPSNYSAIWNQPRWLPSLTAIRRMSREDFYAPMSKHRNYFCAWKLVHVLSNTSADRRLRFRRYLSALGHGAPDDAAWHEAFNGASMEELASDYATYQRRDRVNRVTTNYAGTRPPAPRGRPLRAGEAHVLWAELLRVEHPDLIAAQLDRAGKADPTWPGILLWRALLLRPPDSLHLLRTYVARAPRDPLGWRALVALRLRRAFTEKALVDMEADVRQLIEHADDPDSLNRIGWYYALRKNPNAGLNFGIRAVQAEPSCARCWDTVGLLYFQAGKIERAVEAQERAVAIYAERAPSEVIDRLRQFRAALRRTPPAGSAR